MNRYGSCRAVCDNGCRVKKRASRGLTRAPHGAECCRSGGSPAGAYINDIHELDFRSDTYSVDLYIWFRWKSPAANPVKTMEFMSRYSPTDHQRNLLVDTP
jgi:hypothetical protein